MMIAFVIFHVCVAIFLESNFCFHPPGFASGGSAFSGVGMVTRPIFLGMGGFPTFGGCDVGGSRTDALGVEGEEETVVGGGTDGDDEEERFVGGDGGGGILSLGKDDDEEVVVAKERDNRTEVAL